MDYDNRYTRNNPQRITPAEMETLELSDYGLSAGTVKGEMFGMQVVDPQTGEPLNDTFYTSKIEKAVSYAEQKFDIAIFPRLIEEFHDYNAPDFNSYMYIHTFKRPIIQVEDIALDIGADYHDMNYDRRADQYNRKRYPRDKWKVYSLPGHIEIMTSPFQTMVNRDLMYNPIYQYNNPYAYPKTSAPQVISTKYIAGLLPRKHSGYNKDWEMPATLEEYINKTVVKQIFQVYGRMIVPIGTQSYSLSMDGIVENVSSNQTSTNTAVAGEVKQLNSDLADLESALRSYFGEGFITV